MDTFDSAYIFLDHGLRLWNSMDSTDRSHNDYFTIYSIYSCLGIYEISTGLNYENAIAHFLNGMRTALSHGDYSNYAVLGSNLTRAFVLRRDTSGLRYAKEIYGLGTRLDDPYIKHIGEMFVLDGETIIIYFEQNEAGNTTVKCSMNGEIIDISDGSAPSYAQCGFII